MAKIEVLKSTLKNNHEDTLLNAAPAQNNFEHGRL